MQVDNLFFYSIAICAVTFILLNWNSIFPVLQTMGNSGSDFKSKVNTVDIELDFEIDPNAGQDEIRKFGYYFNKRGECRAIKDDERVGRFPSQREYEEFGAALERYIFYLLRTQYRMTEKIIGVNENDDDDDNDDQEENKNDDNNDVDIEPEPEPEPESEKEQKDKEKSKSKSNTKSKSKKPKRKPRENDDKLAKARIFLSPNYGEKETLLLLIPGSGAVRAGQWARSICINDNLAAGCMYPFIAEAYKRDWG